MDTKALMAQLQGQFAAAQKRLDALEVASSSGGEDGVEMVVSGNFKIKKLKIKMVPQSREDVEIIEDLIISAYEDAYKKIEVEIKKGTGMR